MKKVYFYKKGLVSLSFILLISFLSPIAATNADSIPSVTTSMQSVSGNGTITLDISSDEFQETGFDVGDLVRVDIAGKTMDLVCSRVYCLIPVGDLFLSLGEDSESVSLQGNMAYFIEHSGIACADIQDGQTVWRYLTEPVKEITITLEEKGYDSVVANAPQIRRGADRSEYSSDEAFANFRAVIAGNIADNVLYRSCSPIDNYYSRSAVADQLSYEHGIQAFLNLCNKDSTLEGYYEENIEISPYYISMKEHVVNQSLIQNVWDEGERKKIGQALKDLLKEDTPWLVHCVEGKDRTGFVLAVLECLMEADREEMIRDYAESFRNWFHLEDDPELCYEIGARAIDGVFNIMSDENQNDYESYSNLAHRYLVQCGLSETDIARLVDKLHGE